MDYKTKNKKPWKNLNNFFKAIKEFFSGFISSSLTPSSPLVSSEPKSSLYECPCGYHTRQREKHSWRLEETSNTENHSKKAEDKIHAHCEGLQEGNNSSGIFLITGYEYKDYNDKEKGEIGLSMDDGYALVSRRSRDGGGAVKELENVDERAERFIKEFREQLRVQRLLSAKSVSRCIFD